MRAATVSIVISSPDVNNQELKAAVSVPLEQIVFSVDPKSVLYVIYLEALKTVMGAGAETIDKANQK